jgi:hypothetical protein
VLEHRKKGEQLWQQKQLDGEHASVDLDHSRLASVLGRWLE